VVCGDGDGDEVVNEALIKVEEGVESSWTEPRERAPLSEMTGFGGFGSHRKSNGLVAVLAGVALRPTG